MAWAEELIEPARVADHPRLAFLCVSSLLRQAPKASQTNAVTDGELSATEVG
jgi:hypothetical protein